MDKFIFYFLVILPFAKGNLQGLNIQRGSCPVFTGANNFNLQTFSLTPWTVSSRSTNFFAGPTDCENQIFTQNQNTVRVLTVFSNRDTEFARAFVASAFPRGTGILGFIPSTRLDNYLQKGTYTIIATDNTSFAVAIQCFEVIGYRFIIIFVLIKGVTPPANLQQLVTAALNGNINLGVNSVLQFTNLEQKCAF